MDIGLYILFYLSQIFYYKLLFGLKICNKLFDQIDGTFNS